MRKILIFGFCIFFASSISAQTPDPGFNGSGKVYTSILSQTNSIQGIVIQPDQKIVVGGTGSNTQHAFIAARYRTDGSLDPTFASSGTIWTAIGSEDYGRCVALQNDGKIIVAGCSYLSSSNQRFALVRYTALGVLDNTFGSSGMVITSVTAGHTDEIRGIAIQNDGKIVVAGYAQSSTGSDYDFAVARYNTNGTLDATFNVDGLLTLDFHGANDWAYGVAIQPDQKIVVVGKSHLGTSAKIGVVRFNTDGTIDNTFNSTGLKELSFDAQDIAGFSVSLQDNGKIIVAGTHVTGTSSSEFAVYRLNSDGSIDNSFNVSGYNVKSFSSGFDYSFSSAVKYCNGGVRKIVLAGASNLNVNEDIAFATFNDDGTLDPSFTSTLDLGGSADEGNAVAIQSDNKVVIAGQKGSASTNIAVVRYLATCPPVSSVDNQSKIENELTITPNPSSESTFIQISHDKAAIYKIQISDISGRVISEIPNKEYIPGTTQISINTGKLSNGMYLIKVISDTGTKIAKMDVVH